MPEGYPYRVVVPTRWNDNDVYGHVNNTVYYAVMDTVINQWLIERAGLDIHAGDPIALCVESGCRYLASMDYPDEFDVGVRIARLGRTSVAWEVAIARARDGLPLAEGRFVHVFVDRATRRPREPSAGAREALSTLVVDPEPH
jgi:acyl-CoA thioester hydrolase